MEIMSPRPIDYVVNTDAENPVMMLDKHIGYDANDGQGIDAAMFVSSLYALCDRGAKTITVRINSPGGNITQGMQIYNAILEVPCKVDTVNIGMAASIAACIFQAGRKRSAYDYSLTMIHEAYDSQGKSHMGVIDKFNTAVCTMLARKANRTQTEIRQMMKKETWMTAAECKQMGFCDEIIESNSVNMPPKKSVEQGVMNVWRHYQNMYKSENTNNKSINMNTILNRLSLPESATEAEVTAKLDSIENGYKATIGELQNKFNAASEELATLKNQIAEKENAEKAAAAAALEVEAKAFVAELVNKGKVANDEEVISLAVEQYKANPEATKKVLGANAVNKSGSPAPETKGSNGNVSKSGTFIVRELAEIANRTKRN